MPKRPSCTRFPTDHAGCRRRRRLAGLVLLVALAHLGALQGAAVPDPPTGDRAAAGTPVTLLAAHVPAPASTRAEPAPPTTPAAHVKPVTPVRSALPAPPTAAPPEPIEPAPVAPPTEARAETRTETPVPAAEVAASASPRAEIGTTVIAAAESAASTTSLALATPSQATRPLPDSGSVAPAPTRIPPSETLRYDVRRGLLSGEGQISWQVSGSQYHLTLEAHMPVFGTIFMQTSQGGFDAAGLAPTRHTEQRLRRSVQALSMVRSAESGQGHVSFSTSTEQLPLQPGLQDRVSWMVQLPALLEGHKGVLQPDQRFDITVASVRGDVQTWHFDVVEAPGANGLVKLVRRSDDPHATRAEAWADPRRHHWLVRVRLQEGSGDPLELTEIRP